MRNFPPPFLKSRESSISFISPTATDQLPVPDLSLCLNELFFAVPKLVSDFFFFRVVLVATFSAIGQFSLFFHRSPALIVWPAFEGPPIIVGLTSPFPVRIDIFFPFMFCRSSAQIFLMIG